MNKEVPPLYELEVYSWFVLVFIMAFVFAACLHSTAFSAYTTGSFLLLPCLFIFLVNPENSTANLQDAELVMACYNNL